MTSNEVVGHYHGVSFYRDDASLCGLVTDFFREGLRHDSPLLMIGTPAHRYDVIARLGDAGIDVDHLQHKGDLRLLDAQATLALFMRDGLPDAAEFSNTLVPIMKELCGNRKGCTIRAFGEMVDVLWRSGLPAAAVRLEVLWNQLANSHDFKLLCGYSIGSFYKDAIPGTAYDQVRHLHTHVVAAGDDMAAVS
jgi:hypothetical protein